MKLFKRDTWDFVESLVSLKWPLKGLVTVHTDPGTFFYEKFQTKFSKSQHNR